jgi:hypothetical protein
VVVETDVDPAPPRMGVARRSPQATQWAAAEA